MQLGVFSPVLSHMSLEESLNYLKGLGVTHMELGCGGYPGTAHADAKKLISDDLKLKELKDTFQKYGMQISALSVHGNPVHPDKSVAASFEADYQAACLLGKKLGVTRIVTFSGCPGDGSGKSPNWVTCAWPPDFQEILNYQWEEVLIPYWKKAAKFAAECGITHICLEMHPGFCVYNPETLLKLRKEVGEIITANFDPSHLFWQGIDPVEAIKYLGKAIGFFHAKDTELNLVNIGKNGVLDTKSYADELSRSWIFRTVGYGHSELDWKKIISALKLVGYNHVISIEHEDSLMTPKEGLEKAAAFLQNLLIKEDQKADVWWA